MFSWQFSSEGQVPPGAVEAGVTADGEKLYFGRVTHDGVTTPGKVTSSLISLLLNVMLASFIHFCSVVLTTSYINDMP